VCGCLKTEIKPLSNYAKCPHIRNNIASVSKLILETNFRVVSLVTFLFMFHGKPNLFTFKEKTFHTISIVIATLIFLV